MSVAQDFVQRAADRRRYLKLSQAEVARCMKERGFAWWAMTVARTESGERPIHLDETVSLSEVLGMPVPLSDDALAADLASAHERIAEQQKRLDYLAAQCDRASYRVTRLESALRGVRAIVNHEEAR